MPDHPSGVIITGGSGHAGQYVVAHFLSLGIHVLNIDLISPKNPLPSPVANASLTHRALDMCHFGHVYETFHEWKSKGYGRVVHLAAVASPGRMPDSETLRINTLSTYNVLHACSHVGISRVVCASSEMVYGFYYDKFPLAQAPITEQTPTNPRQAYSLSKVLGEQMADMYAAHFGLHICSLRINNIIRPDDYARFLSWQNDPLHRIWNLWGYVDARDVARACQLALDNAPAGHHRLNIAAGDIVMNQDSATLLSKCLPMIAHSRPILGRESLMDCAKAAQIIGYKAKYSWKDAPNLVV